ncbi:MAG: conserved membrane protein of unknown function [Promethearchaeota archaeon]|nr:MAG: conserved membrane protein of unknown function [Candidatus Lokiarchaeota archaeon]
MIISWNLEIISNIVIISLIGLMLIITQIKTKVRSLTSLKYIRIALFLFSLMFILEIISDIYLNRFIALISAFMLIPFNLLITMGINYIEKETSFSYNLVLIIALTPLFVYLGFLPESIVLFETNGSISLVWGGIFALYGEFFTLIAVIFIFRLGFKTWKNAPFLIKKEAIIFFIGSSLIFPVSIVVYLFSYFERFFLIFSNFILILGFIIIITTIYFEPKLLYILPFLVNRILVKNKDGSPLFDHSWAESSVKPLIFTGFLNAVQKMGEEIIKLGGILDIHLKEGILILYESLHITVGLVASKSSQLLRECIVNFTLDFEQEFLRLLKLKIIDKKAYEGAYVLLEKYFSNFPNKQIHSRSQPLLLTSHINLPSHQEDALRSIFLDLTKYPHMNIDIQKSNLPIVNSFLNLYRKIQNEEKEISENGENQLYFFSKDENDS